MRLSFKCGAGRQPLRHALFTLAGMLSIPALLLLQGCGPKEAKTTAQAAPALTVQAASAKRVEWPQTIQVSGPIVAWQEAIIGSEIAGQRLVELRVNVGDRVKKGDVLARYNTDTLQAEQAELKALWQQAEADRVRALALDGVGALSRQQVDNYINQAAVAKARLDAKNLQLRYATVVAPADGVVSARSATLGAIGTVGSELFRLILNGRLEWRGELSAEQLPLVKAGQTVALALPDGTTAQAKIRQLSPSLDARSRMATAYADIAPGSGAHAGMYVSGTIAMQARSALVVPAVSVIIRDGRNYVFTIGAANSSDASTKVTQQLVTTGRHRDSEIEITSGLNESARVVLQGAGFLNDGDSVRVVADKSGKAGAQ
ncbi:MAG: efflux RND transporter periplasmic adaptor subunit [Spongiibacteraceae bacterium]